MFKPTFKKQQDRSNKSNTAAENTVNLINKYNICKKQPGKQHKTVMIKQKEKQKSKFWQSFDVKRVGIILLVLFFLDESQSGTIFRNSSQNNTVDEYAYF